jgi:hypothetical protein
MSYQDLVNAQLIALMPAGQKSADTTGTGVDVSGLEGKAIAILDITNVSGTTPTADVKLQESDTSGGTYTDVAGGAFTQVTTVAGVQKLQVNIDVTKKFVRAFLDVGGTSPVYGVGVLLVGRKKYT